MWILADWGKKEKKVEEKEERIQEENLREKEKLRGSEKEIG